MSRLPSQEKPWLALVDESYEPVSDCTVFEFLHHNRPYDPDALALKYFSARYSYQQLFDAIEDYARGFVALGVKPGDTVVVALPTSPEHVITFYALNCIGAIADLVDLRSKGDVLDYYLSEAPVKAVIVCDLFAANFISSAKRQGIEHVIVVPPAASLSPFMRLFLGKKVKTTSVGGVDLKSFLAQGRDCALPQCVGSSKDIAAIMHSSGTTGNPKSICMSNGAVNAMVANVAFIAKYAQPGEIFMNQVPPFLAYNIIMGIHLPLCSRVIVHLLPEYRPDLFAANVSKIKPTYVIAGPADWCNFLECPPSCKDFSFLRIAASGSDSMNQKAMAEVNQFLAQRGCKTQIIEGYGLTEIGSAAVFNHPNNIKAGSLGVPLPGNSICIYDNENQQELSYHQSGEICLTGPSLMSGYYNNPEGTNEMLKVHEDGITWLHTGDLGFLDEEGFLFFEGRLKRIIVRHDGIKVPSNTVEQLISKQHGVADCSVVGRPDAQNNRGEITVAFVVLEQAASTSETLDAVRVQCQSELPEDYWPVEYHILDILPLTPNGKVDFCKLQTMELDD